MCVCVCKHDTDQLCVCEGSCITDNEGTHIPYGDKNANIQWKSTLLVEVAGFSNVKKKKTKKNEVVN